MDVDGRPEDSPLCKGLEDIPADAFGAPAPEGLFRERVLAITSAKVRTRARRRRQLMASALTLFYVGSVGGTAVAVRNWYVTPASATPVVAQAERPSTPQAPPAPEEPPLTPVAAVVSVPAWEQLAVSLSHAASAEEQMRLLRTAGDRAMATGDLKLATQCYRRLLDLLQDQGGFMIQSNDNWLLARLKMARQQEKNHDSSNT